MEELLYYFRGIIDPGVNDKIVNINKKVLKDLKEQGFIYGNLIQNHERFWIDMPYYGEIAILPNTKGLYSHQKDKFNQRIFQGDIITDLTYDNATGDITIGEVAFGQWEDTTQDFLTINYGFYIRRINIFNFYDDSSEYEGSETYSLLNIEQSNIQVIGNIHEGYDINRIGTGKTKKDEIIF